MQNSFKSSLSRWRLVCWAIASIVISAPVGSAIAQENPDRDIARTVRIGGEPWTYDETIPFDPDWPEKNVDFKTQRFPPFRRGSAPVPVPPALTIEHIRSVTAFHLSELCVHTRFNQRRKGRYFVRVPRMGGGVHRLEAATIASGNLHDPDEVALPHILYLFEGDTTSECRIYTLPMESVSRRR